MTIAVERARDPVAHGDGAPLAGDGINGSGRNGRAWWTGPVAARCERDERESGGEPRGET